MENHIAQIVAASAWDGKKRAASAQAQIKVIVDKFGVTEEEAASVLSSVFEAEKASNIQWNKDHKDDDED